MRGSTSFVRGIWGKRAVARHDVTKSHEKTPAPGRGKLTSFQRMMLNWEDLHPYVAVHALKLPRPVPRARLRDSVDAVLAQAGLTCVSFDPSGKSCRWGEIALRPEMGLVPQPAGPTEALQNEIARQLNLAFPAGPHCPLRFFCLVEGGEAAFLGMAYHHAVADAHSAALILQRILEHALDVPPGDAAGKLNLRPPSMRAAFPGDLSLRRSPAVLGGILRDFFRYKRAFTPDYQSPEDQSVGFRIASERVALAPARAFAQKHGVTLQDVVFAALLEALARHFPLGEKRRGWRRRLAVATAVDLRRYASVGLENTVGQFLGSYAVVHDVPPGRPFRGLVADVAAQSEYAKRRRLFFSHVWTFALMDRLWPALSAGLKRRHSKWIFPLSGAISNMNLSPLFGRLGVPFYLRAASTGPIIPLLIDITTVDETFSLTAIFRRSAFTEDQACGIAGHVRSRLEVPSWSVTS